MAGLPLKTCAGTVPGVPVKVGAPTEPVSTAALPAKFSALVTELAPVKVSAGTVPALPAKVGCVKLPAAIVGAFAGQEIVGCVKLPPAMVGTPAGHATVPDGVPADTAELVSSAPVNTSAGMVMEGELEAAAALLSVEKTYFDGLVTGTSVDAEVIDCVAFVPVGVSVCVCVASAAPANVGTPAGQEIAPSENAPLALVGTLTGQEIAPSEKLPPELDPAGVKEAVLFEPSGVTVPVEFVPPGV